MNTAYAEARRNLSEHNFRKAADACQTYLAKYPNNAIFQALKYDIEEQQRQELSAFIASVDRQGEAEPDLDKRVNILREALDLHPGESHFERALRLVQDKRDLVNSIVARAHLHEEQGSYGDALNDWEILRTIYNQYPGLTFEVERLQKRRDQQTRVESKTRLVEQVDACLHSSDYARALDLLQGAVAEFPSDAELTELEKLAQDGVKRKTEAHRLMTEGQELCAQQKSTEGIELLREAYELDENNSLARAVLANSLVEHAHSIVESDWREAEKLAREALDLNPGHPMAKTIRTLILDQKRETFVGECVSQARKLQTASDLAGALSRVEEGLSVYPREPRLIQIQETVQRDLQTQRRQSRRRDLEELRRMGGEFDASTEAAEKQALVGRLRALAEKYSTDGEILSVANGVLHRLGLLEVDPKITTPSPASESATLTYSTPPVSTPDPSLARTSNVSAAPPSANAVPVASGAASASAEPVPPAPPNPPSVPVATSPAKPPASALKSNAPSLTQPARPRQSYTTILFASAAAIFLAGAFFFFVRRHHAPPVTQTPETALAVSVPVTPSAQSGLSVVKLSSDTGTGRVTFDDQPPAEFQDGQWTLDKLPTGEHKLKFEGAREESSFTFTFLTGAAALPIVKSPIASKGVLAVVVSSMADHLHVYSSDLAARVSLDGQAPLDLPQDGLDLPSISAGAHELSVTRGSDQYKLDIDAGAVPTLNAFLESGQNMGTLVVVTGQDKTRVFLDGKLQPQPTQGGQLRIPSLELKDYVVRVSKSGFQDLPEQKIRVRKGEQTKMIFNLQPIPHLASLTIQGGVPGTTVLIDQSPVGTIQPDGTITVATVNPGDHTVELRKDRFKPRQIKKHFVVGTGVTLSTADVALDAAPGELKITFAPAEAQVTLNKAGETPAKVNSGGTLSLAAGTYTLTAKTADNFSRSSTLEVTAGQSRSLDLSLSPSGMSKWDDPAGWKQDKASFVRRGGDFVMYSVSPTTGTFVFSAMLTKGHRLQWMLNCTDANNYVLLQMDDNNFYRAVVRNGQKGDETKIPHKGDKKTFRNLQIRVGANEIVHQIRQGDNWVVLDRYTQPGDNLSLGRFGFYIPGGDQVALASFGHYLDFSPR
jgi:tetratricopeptide (TPR) repeat protein